MGGVLSSSKKKDDGFSRSPSKMLNISKADVFAGLTDGRRGLLAAPGQGSGDDDDGPPGLDDDGPPGLDDYGLEDDDDGGGRTPGRLLKQGTMGLFGSMAHKVTRCSIVLQPHWPRSAVAALAKPLQPSALSFPVPELSG